jgi:hypothetical protein
MKNGQEIISTIESIGYAPLVFSYFLSERTMFEKRTLNSICDGCFETAISKKHKEKWESVERGKMREVHCPVCGKRKYSTRQVKSNLLSYFPNGIKSVLAIGTAGSGKTYTMNNIHFATNFGKAKGAPQFSSFTGTARGKMEIFAMHRDSVVFLDEIGIESKKDFDLFKQIANGEIVYTAFGRQVKYDFDGFFISACNGIYSSGDMANLDATIQRLYVVDMNNTATDWMEKVDREKMQNIHNTSLRHWRTPYTLENLSEENQKIVDELWQEREGEVLSVPVDNDKRGKTRAEHDFEDIFKFGVHLGFNLTHEPDLQFLLWMTREIVTTNPIKAIKRTPVEEFVYRVLQKGDVMAAEIQTELCRRMISPKTINASLGKMIDRNLINGYDSVYSLKRIEQKSSFSF